MSSKAEEEQEEKGKDYSSRQERGRKAKELHVRGIDGGEEDSEEERRKNSVINY